MVNTNTCPCGTDKTYEDCCKALHQGSRVAISAEELRAKIQQSILDMSNL